MFSIWLILVNVPHIPEMNVYSAGVCRNALFIHTESIYLVRCHVFYILTVFLSILLVIEEGILKAYS